MECAQNFDKDTLQQLKNLLSSSEYEGILKPSSNKNNIIIENERIYRLSQGKVVKERNLNIADLVKRKDEIALPKMGSGDFWSPAIKFSPFEADRDKKRDEKDKVWKNRYEHINFPFLMPLAISILLETGTFPTLIDLIKLYIGLYTEPVPEGKEVQHRPTYVRHPETMVDKEGNMIDRKGLGETITYVDGSIIKNRLLRFKREYLEQCYVKTKIGHSRILSFPYNEFTAEMIANRIKKAYASLIRDLLFGMQCYLHEEDAKRESNIVYNLYFDIALGVDLIFNDTYVLGSTATKGADLFNEIKAEQEECRHENLKEVKYAVRTKANIQGSDGICTISHEKLHDFCENVVAHKYTKTGDQIPWFVYGNAET